MIPFPSTLMGRSKYILDRVRGAVAAYSLRLLTGRYQGPCVRVRRSRDNAEQDIGFVDRQGLDTASLLEFVGPAYPLDAIGTTAAAAYSVRKLRAGYSGPCMRVRRSSDNAEADIGFSGGWLDETALMAHVGPSNICLQSEDFNVAPWATLNLSLDAGTNPAPSGSNAFALYDSALGTRQRFAYAGQVSLTPGTTYTASVYAKKNQLSVIQVSLSNLAFTDSQTWANFDLENGVVGHTGSAVLGTALTAVGGGWYRCSVTGLCYSDAVAPVIFFGPLDTDRDGQFPAYPNASASGIFIWGAQVNAGAATQYVRSYSVFPGEAFVTKWYSQSSSLDLSQGVAASQPAIVTAGSVAKKGGRPAILSGYQGATITYLLTTQASLQMSRLQTHIVATMAQVSGGGYPRFISMSNSGGSLDYGSYGMIPLLAVSGSSEVAVYHDVALSRSPVTLDALFCASSIMDSTTYTRLNGAAGPLENTAVALDIGRIALFNRSENGSAQAVDNWKGTASEILLFSTTLSNADTYAIEGSQSRAFGIAGQADAFVTKWYDQIGTVNYSKTTAALQPKLVTAGALETDNGRGCIYGHIPIADPVNQKGLLDAEGDQFAGLTSVTGYAVFNNSNRVDKSSCQGGPWQISTNMDGPHYPYNNDTAYDNFMSPVRYMLDPYNYSTTLRAHFSVHTGTQLSNRVNGQTVKTVDALYSTGLAGGNSLLFTSYATGRVSEVAFFNHALSTQELVAVESEGMRYYGITP